MLDGPRALNIGETDGVAIVLPTALGDSLVSMPSIWSLVTSFRRNRKCIVCAAPSVSLFAGLNLCGADCTSDEDLKAAKEVDSFRIVFDFRSMDDSPQIIAKLGAKKIFTHAFVGEHSEHHYSLLGKVVPALTFRPGWNELEETLVDSAWGMDAGLVCAAFQLARPSTEEMREVMAGFRSNQSWARIKTSNRVVFAPCGSNVLKKWPDACWNALALLLSAEGFSIAVAIGPQDRDPVCSDIPHQTLDNLSLDRLASHFQQSYCVVANDCGPMHLAAVFGCPTLAIFGPTNEDIWFPYGASTGKALRSGPRNTDRNGGLIDASPWRDWPDPALVYSEVLSLSSYQVDRSGQSLGDMHQPSK